MGRKSKFSYEQKLNAVLDYDNGKDSLRGIASKVGASYTTVREWYMIYQSQGGKLVLRKRIQTGIGAKRQKILLYLNIYQVKVL